MKDLAQARWRPSLSSLVGARGLASICDARNPLWASSIAGPSVDRDLFRHQALMVRVLLAVIGKRERKRYG
jgi:hypothetical protein